MIFPAGQYMPPRFLQLSSTTYSSENQLLSAQYNVVSKSHTNITECMSRNSLEYTFSNLQICDGNNMYRQTYEQEIIYNNHGQWITLEDSGSPPLRLNNVNGMFYLRIVY